MFNFDKIPQTQLRNTNGYVPPSIKNTFFLLRSHCNIHTRQCEIYIRDLAKESRRKNRTICYHLAWLIDNGFIHRQLRKKKNNPKENDRSLFTILRWDLPEIECSQATNRKIAVHTEFSCIHKETREYLKERKSKETNLTGEAILPTSKVGLSSLSEKETSTQREILSQPRAETPEGKLEFEALQTSELHPTYDERLPIKGEEPRASKPVVESKASIRAEEPEEPQSKAENATSTKSEERSEAELNLDGVPDILRPTAIMILKLSGRTQLKADELRLLKELGEKHTPNRIDREIDKRAEYFRANGRNMKSLTMYYIHKILIGQPATLNPDTVRARKKAARRDKKATKSTARTERVELETAEDASVGECEYVPDAPVAPKSAETSELLDSEMSLEEAQKVIADYQTEQKPQLELPTALLEMYGAIAEKMGEDETLSVNDYLKVCLPEYDADELQHIYDRSPAQMQIWVREAMLADKWCTKCTSPEHCRNRNCKRIVVSIRTRPDGTRYIHAETEVSFTCKHASQKPETNPVYTKYVDASGLTPSQSEHTFESYQCSTDELTVTKAKAIQAAQNGRNLILAGKAGTGKTHLAIAIALYTMKQGKQAYVKNVPDLIDEIRQARLEHRDEFGLMVKYKSVPLLVLDDLGKQINTEAAWTYLYQIIDYRYTHGLQTIVTTNAYKADGLKKKWNEGNVEPVVSRLLEKGDWVTIREAKNYRMTIRSRRLEEVKARKAEPKSLEAPVAEEPVLVHVEPELDNTVCAECAEVPEPFEPEAELPEDGGFTEYSADNWDETLREAEYTTNGWDETLREPDIADEGGSGLWLSRDEDGFISMGGSPAPEPEAEVAPERSKHYTEEDWYKELMPQEQIAVQMYYYEQARQSETSDSSEEKPAIEAEAAASTRMGNFALTDGDANSEHAESEDKAAVYQSPSKGIVIHVPLFDDGLDDEGDIDEHDLRLYGGLYSD